jgi:uncharacterized membrane protein HdeD (DUF308 family)
MNLANALKQSAKSTKLLGISLIVLGALSIIAPLVAGLSVTIMIGILLVASGAMMLYIVAKVTGFREGALLALFAVLNVVAGGFMLTNTGEALATLTLFLAAYFVASGILEILSAFQSRPSEGWGQLAFSGVLALILGMMIWSQFPLSGVWAIGILVGTRLIVTGWALTWVGSRGESLLES